MSPLLPDLCVGVGVAEPLVVVVGAVIEAEVVVVIRPGEEAEIGHLRLVSPVNSGFRAINHGAVTGLVIG